MTSGARYEREPVRNDERRSPMMGPGGSSVGVIGLRLKSRNLRVPSVDSMMFSSLMSRWATPMRCMCRSAHTHCTNTPMAVASVIAPASMTLSKSSTARRSKTVKMRPPTCRLAKTRTM